MIRILIFILALNAFIAPASAKTACGMDMSPNSVQMMQSSDAGDEAMSGEDMVCCSLECVADCTYHFSPFSISTESPVIQKVALFRPLVIASVSLSKLVLPINTPPPLV
jgi:hypothetical protein